MAFELGATARRVLMLCNDRQIDRRILLQADSLEEDGWQVIILAMPLDAPLEEDPRILRVGSHKAVQAQRENHVLAAYRLFRRWLPMNGRVMRVLKSFAWRFLVDQERFYLTLFLADARLHPAAVVVAHDLPMLAVGAVLADEFAARLVYDSHELYCEQEFSGGQQLSWARIERKYIAKCDRVITVNPSIANELERRYGVPEVAVIHNAERVVPLQERSWYLHEHYQIAREHPVLLFQGGLSAGRNLEALIEAMTLPGTDGIHLVLLGNGQLAARLRRLILRHGLHARVHLHPAVAQTELLRVTMAADAGVIPYQPICLNNYYCTPNKLFEFTAAGLPILASDLPELRRLIQGNDIGMVADLSTAERIAAAMAAFFADPARLNAWRERLRAVRHELSWQSEGERLKQIYRTLR